MDNNISEIVSASLDVSKNSVMFEFKTPLSAGIRYEFHIIIFIEVLIKIMMVIMMMFVIKNIFTTRLYAVNQIAV